MASDSITHEANDHGGGFFIADEGTRVGELIYTRVKPGVVVIDHTEVSRTHEGRGLARNLLDAAVEWARATGTRIIPSCPFASAQFARDPSLRDVLA